MHQTIQLIKELCGVTSIPIHLFYVLQINGVDMTDSTHEDAVALLTGSTNEIRLVVYRETLVMEHPRSPTLPAEPASPIHNDIRAAPISPSVKMMSSPPVEAKLEVPHSAQLISGPVLAPPRPAVPAHPSWMVQARTNNAPEKPSQTVVSATAAARTSFLQSPVSATKRVNGTSVISSPKTVAKSPAAVTPVSNIRSGSFNHEGYEADSYPVEVRFLAYLFIALSGAQVRHRTCVSYLTLSH